VKQHGNLKVSVVELRDQARRLKVVRKIQKELLLETVIKVNA